MDAVGVGLLKVPVGGIIMQLPFSLIHLSETTLVFDVPSVIKVLDKTARGGRISVLLPSSPSLGQRSNGMIAVHFHRSTTEATLGRKIQPQLDYFRLCEPQFHEGSWLGSRGCASNRVAILLITLRTVTLQKI